MTYLCANFSLPRPLCSRLRPGVRDRQTDVRRASSLNASALWGGHNNRKYGSTIERQPSIVHMIVSPPRASDSPDLVQSSVPVWRRFYNYD